MATKLKAIKGGKAEEVEEVLKVDVDDITDTRDQPIKEVSQDELKKAMKSLLTRKNDIIALLYAKHDEFNKQYFRGELSIPLITIERMDNRTLANYTYSGNAIPIDNHIRFNRNFIALNQGEDGQCTRILETLKHEMIHQWQDQVLYHHASVAPKPIVIPLMGEDGKVSEVEMMQKKSPKDHHNKDFKEMAKVVGIPAKGAKCYGNPANMPEPKSYNRKFACGCVASNGYPVTVWSTREVFAKCTVCDRPFVELKKKNPKAQTIEVNTSHVEREGEDAIEISMADLYDSFQRFATKEDKDEFLRGLLDSAKEAGTDVVYDEGIYQKYHNAYKDLGQRYWIAYSVTIRGEAVENKILVLSKPKASKPAKTPKKPKVKTSGKAEKGSKDMENQEKQIYDNYDVNNPKDLIHAYQAMGTIKKASELVGISQSAFVKKAKEYQIDFKAGTFVPLK